MQSSKEILRRSHALNDNLCVVSGTHICQRVAGMEVSVALLKQMCWKQHNMCYFKHVLSVELNSTHKTCQKIEHINVQLK